MSNQPQEPHSCMHCTAMNIQRLAAANAAPRCGARRRRDGRPCCAPAMWNGRCHKHGGASRGPVTASGLDRSQKARLVHGRRNAEARQAARERGAARREMAALNALLRELDELAQEGATP
ncbi:HGGxSTG domain-containing protein [Belnapia arida]|uniref:HGGxSTG domain-containing protein n=1 Tax=Belnapia arida TaxID=2804533 RepID=UPI002E29E712|nr:HGGxSTG domain-containing protein [Belnapia arida]